MINVGNGIKNAYDISTTQIDKIIVDGEEYRITKVQYDDDCYEEGNIFGTAIARCLEFEVENTVDLENKEFEYITGLKINNEINWISLGNFITTDIEANDTTNISKITSMDYMLKSNIIYTTDLNYDSGNISLLQVVKEACNKADIVLATEDFANNGFIVDSNQFGTEALIRQVFQAAAQISGTVAKIKSDNKLHFINPNSITDVSKVFTLNNYEEAEIKRLTHPINIVSLGMTDIEGENVTLRDENSILHNGENTLTINDNPFAYTQAKREQLITALFNAVKGFEYKSYAFKCQSLFYLETMDKIQFKDRKGCIYSSYIFRFNYKSPNGLDSSIEAPSIIRSTVRYQNLPSALDIAKHTEALVNKQEGRITLLAEETKTNIDNINNSIKLTDKFEKQNNVTINSAEANLFNVNLYGESTQETRYSENLAYVDLSQETTVNGITITPLGKGKFKLDGTSTALGSFYIQSYNLSNSKVIKLNNGQTYYYKLFEMGGTKTNGLITELLGTDKFYISISSADSINGKAFTMSTDTNMNGIRINIPKNSTYSDYIFAIALEENIPTNYTEYGSMPSTEFLSEIISVHGGIDIKVLGKNLLKSVNPTRTNNGLTFTRNDDGSITINGTSTNTVYYNINRAYDNSIEPSKYFTLKKDAKYTLYLKNNVSSINMVVRTSSQDLILLSTGKGNEINCGTYSNETDADAFAYLMISGGVTFNNLTVYPMILDGEYTLDTIGDYEPHKEMNTTIELPEEVELCSLPNDTQDYIDNTGLIHKRIKNRVLDSTDTWYLYNDENENFISFYQILEDSFNSYEIMCTHFKQIVYGDFTQNGIALNLNNGICYLMITIGKNKLQTANVEGFKDYLSTQYENNTPVKFQYELESEDVSQSLSDVDKEKLKNIKTFKGITRITSSAKMSASYYRDNDFNAEYETKINSTKNYTEIRTDIGGIKNTVSETNTYINNNIVTRIVETEQNLDGMKISLNQTGGQNLIKNSTLRFGIDKNVTTIGTVTVEQYSEILNNTISKSAIKINNGSVIFNPVNTKEGYSYTFSCLANRLELANPSITITNVLDEKIEVNIKSNEFVEVKKTFTALSGQVQIKLESDNNYCLFADCMLNAGSEKINWQLASGEIANKSVTINDDGAKFSNLLIKTEFIIDAAGNKIINTETGETRAQFNADDTFVNNFRVDGTSRHGNLINTDFGDHIVGSWANSQEV